MKDVTYNHPHSANPPPHSASQPPTSTQPATQLAQSLSCAEEKVALVVAAVAATVTRQKRKDVFSF